VVDIRTVKLAVPAADCNVNAAALDVGFDDILGIATTGNDVNGGLLFGSFGTAGTTPMIPPFAVEFVAALDKMELAAVADAVALMSIVV
jgi:hypothetical protein